MRPQKMGNMLEKISYFTQLGGAAVLQPAVDDFVERLLFDPMIGFHFKGVDSNRLKLLEFQFMARALGADIAYEGRPMRQAHASRTIFAGQFARRQTLLKNTLLDHGIDPTIVGELLAHNEKLRPAVLNLPDQDCLTMTQSGPLVTHVPVARLENVPVAKPENVPAVNGEAGEQKS